MARRIREDDKFFVWLSVDFKKYAVVLFLLFNKILFFSLHNLEKTNEISKMHKKIDDDLQRHFMDVLKNNEEIRV